MAWIEACNGCFYVRLFQWTTKGRLTRRSHGEHVAPIASSERLRVPRRGARFNVFDNKEPCGLVLVPVANHAKGDWAVGVQTPHFARRPPAGIFHFRCRRNSLVTSSVVVGLPLIWNKISRVLSCDRGLSRLRWLGDHCACWTFDGSRARFPVSTWSPWQNTLTLERKMNALSI